MKVILETSLSFLYRNWETKPSLTKTTRRPLNATPRPSRLTLRSQPSTPTVSDTCVLTNIGAAVNIALEKFDESIKDCEKALEVNPKFVKAYFRKAQALREKLDNLGAMEALKQAMEIEPTNEEFKKLFEETKTEYEEDNSIAVDHPERARFETLLKWLKEGGSEFDKLKIRYYTADYRGVHAARDIKKGETILYIPKE